MHYYDDNEYEQQGEPVYYQPSPQEKKPFKWQLYLFLILCISVFYIVNSMIQKPKMLDESNLKEHSRNMQTQSLTDNAYNNSDKERVDKTAIKMDFSGYMTNMQKQIKANWHPPKGNESKKVVVLFNIARNGKLNSAKILKSSGVDGLDKSALKALEAASPFEALPDGYKKENVDVQFTFDYNVFGPVR